MTRQQADELVRLDPEHFTNNPDYVWWRHSNDIRTPWQCIYGLTGPGFYVVENYAMRWFLLKQMQARWKWLTEPIPDGTEIMPTGPSEYDALYQVMKADGADITKDLILETFINWKSCLVSCMDEVKG